MFPSRHALSGNHTNGTCIPLTFLFTAGVCDCHVLLCPSVFLPSIAEDSPVITIAEYSLVSLWHWWWLFICLSMLSHQRTHIKHRWVEIHVWFLVCLDPIVSPNTNISFFLPVPHCLFKQTEISRYSSYKPLSHQIIWEAAVFQLPY